MKKRLLIGVTGSVATIKLPILIDSLLQNDLEVTVMCTENSKHFFDPVTITSEVRVCYDADEWSTWQNRGDPVLHIELTKWADCLLIAPLDANTLAKIASGLCDNLLTSTIRAWSPSKPLLFCPAMNTQMWNHPITETHISTLESWGYQMIPCVAKKLMCGDVGLGAMAEVPTIVDAVLKVFACKGDL